MPEQSSPAQVPSEQVVPQKSSNSTTILVISAVVVVLLVVVGVAAYSLFWGKQSLPDKASTARVTGDAGELYPYGQVEEDKNVSALIGPEGGVLSADLAKGVKAYLVVPPGYSGVDGDIYKLTPYFSMPTSKKAPALPTDLGYGVDFEIENYNAETLEPLYLVFDLDNGKTVSEIAKDTKLNSFCLPTLASFNPAGCALLKGVSLENHTDTKYGVVSPIRDLEHNDLMFMNSTVPLGYDKLIVVQVTNQATFIPIVLSQDVLTDVVRADKPGFAMPLIEAMVHAVNNNIYYDDPETYYHLNKAFFTGGDPVDSNKALKILPKYKEYLNGLKSQAGNYATESIDTATASNYLDLQLGDYPALETDLNDRLFKYLGDRGSTSSSNAHQTLLAILHTRRFEAANFPQAKATREAMVEKILADVAYYVDVDANASVNNKLMYMSAIWGTPEYFAKTQITAGKQTGLGLLQPVAATSSSILPAGAPQSWVDLIAKAIAEAEYTLSNPCAHSIFELLKAAQLAQLVGRDDIADQLIAAIQDRLISNLRGGGSTMQDWAMGQMFGLDNDYACVNDLYRDQVGKSSKKLTCTTLMEKNLKNFGMNEIQCREVLLPDDPPTIPDDCKLPNPAKCS